MRKVVFFVAGTVADFHIPSDRFEDFTKHMDWQAGHSREELDKARRVLERFVKEGEGRNAGASEIAAACFVWNFFNTHPDDAMHIKGDVLIVDLKGDGETIDYTPLADVKLAPLE